MRRIFKLIFLLLLAYVGSYVWFRSSHAEVWQRDGKTYVIFPAGQAWVWQVYRPITSLDASVTGMRFHIGPHR